MDALAKNALLKKLAGEQAKGNLRQAHIDIVHSAWLGTVHPVVTSHWATLGTNDADLEGIFDNLIEASLKSEFRKTIEPGNGQIHVSKLARSVDAKKVKDEVLRKTLELWPTLRPDALARRKDLQERTDKFIRRLKRKPKLTPDEEHDLTMLSLHYKYPLPLTSFMYQLAAMRILPEYMAPLRRLGVILPHKKIGGGFNFTSIPLKKGQKQDPSTRYLIPSEHLVSIGEFLQKNGRNPAFPQFHREPPKNLKGLG